MTRILSPQLKIRELDQSEYIPQITGARFGIVTVAKKGAINELTLITSEPELIATFGDPFTNHYGIHAGLQYLRRGSNLLVVRVSDGTHAIAAAAVRDSASNLTMTFQALSPGTHGNDLTVVVSAASNGAAADFDVVVQQNGVTVEEFRNCKHGLANEDDARYVETLINGISALIQVTDEAPSTAQRPDNGTFPLIDGSDGIAALTGSDYIGLQTPALTGMQIFRDVQEVDVTELAVPGVSDSAVISEVQSVCEDRGDCLGIIDPPDNLSFSGIVDWHNGVSSSGNSFALNSSRICMFWPWVRINDNFNGVDVWVPPSGFIAAAIALTDDSAEPWFAPGGYARGRIFEALSTRTKLTQAQQDFIYSGGNSVNPIRTFSGEGTYLFGNRTLQRTATALDRIHVRRGLLFIEKGISQVSRQFQFEPNDAITWRRWKSLVEPFLAQVQGRRGLERFRVIIDDSTNPAAQRQQQIMAARIFLVFTSVAESIQLDFVLKPNGSTFNEAVITG